MDVEKVISEALFEHRGTAHDMASDIMNDLAANGLTVVPNEVVEALRRATQQFNLYADGHEFNTGNARASAIMCEDALAKLDQPQ